MVTDFLAELFHYPDSMAAEAVTLSGDAVARVRSKLRLWPTRLKGAGIHRMATGRDAAFMGCMTDILPSRYDHFLNNARGSASYAAAVREAWGRLQAANAGHLSDADARVMEPEAEVASDSQKELTAFLDHANNCRLQNEVFALSVTCRERILFNLVDAALGMRTVAILIARTITTPAA
eukprot:jgi/Tetstr1/453458/TSEL_040439.t1